MADAKPNRPHWALAASVAFALVTTVTPVPEAWQPLVIPTAWALLAAAGCGWLITGIRKRNEMLILAVVFSVVWLGLFRVISPRYSLPSTNKTATPPVQPQAPSPLPQPPPPVPAPVPAEPLAKGRKLPDRPKAQPTPKLPVPGPVIHIEQKSGAQNQAMVNSPGGSQVINATGPLPVFQLGGSRSNFIGIQKGLQWMPTYGYQDVELNWPDLIDIEATANVTVIVMQQTDIARIAPASVRIRNITDDETVAETKYAGTKEEGVSWIVKIPRSDDKKTYRLETRSISEGVSIAAIGTVMLRRNK